MKNLIIFMLLTLLSLTSSAEALKIGIVDVNKILKEAPQTISANKKLEKEFNSRTEKLKQKVKELQADEKKISKRVFNNV